LIKMKILIVDDEIEICSLFKNIIETYGHEIKLASNGDAALDTYRKFRPDLVLMDYRMPGKDGLKTTEEIFNYDPEAQILFCSADSSVKGKAMERGAVGFLQKPFDLEVLIDTIDIYEKKKVEVKKIKIATV